MTLEDAPEPAERPQEAPDERPGPRARPTAAPQPGASLDAQASHILLQLVEGLTAASYGERAKFSPSERAMIEPSLKRIMDRMTPKSAAVFGSFADPILLATGLMIWAARVFGTPQAATRQEPIRPDFNAPRAPGGVAYPTASVANVPPPGFATPEPTATVDGALSGAWHEGSAL